MTARQRQRVTPLSKPVFASITLTPIEPASVLAWQAFALCAQTDPERFFPEMGQPTAPAKTVCRACPVRTECLEDALSRDEAYGVWGGLSTQQRRALKRQRAGAAFADTMEVAA